MRLLVFLPQGVGGEYITRECSKHSYLHFLSYLYRYRGRGNNYYNRNVGNYNGGGGGYNRGYRGGNNYRNRSNNRSKMHNNRDGSNSNGIMNNAPNSNPHNATSNTNDAATNLKNQAQHPSTPGSGSVANATSASTSKTAPSGMQETNKQLQMAAVGAGKFQLPILFFQKENVR